MKNTIVTTVVTLIVISMFSLKVMANGNVMTFVESGGSTLYIIGDNTDNEIRISSLYGGETLLVEGLNGTTINGAWSEYDHPGFQYANIVVDLKHGDDVLKVENLNMGGDRFDVYQGGGNATITLENSTLGSSKIITGRGQDTVTLGKVEGVHVRISDAEGAFPLNVAMPSTSSSIFTFDTSIDCLDLQAQTVEVDNQNGALIVAATDAQIDDVDSTSGNAQLGIWPGLQISVEPSSVIVAAEFDSADSEVSISRILTSELSVLYYNTPFNDRPSSHDNILVDGITADNVAVATGMGADRVIAKNVDADRDVLIDLGSDSDRGNLDGSNYALVYGVSSGDDCEIVGGSGRDYVYIHSAAISDSLTVDTMYGSDTVRLYFADVIKDTDVDLGSGTDNLKSYKSSLSGLSIDGGFGKDRAIQVQSTWSNATLDSVEYSNF